jgi:hypothetical protein
MLHVVCNTPPAKIFLCAGKVFSDANNIPTIRLPFLKKSSPTPIKIIEREECYVSAGKLSNGIAKVGDLSFSIPLLWRDAAQRRGGFLYFNKGIATCHLPAMVFPLLVPCSPILSIIKTAIPFQLTANQRFKVPLVGIPAARNSRRDCLCDDGSG